MMPWTFSRNSSADFWLMIEPDLTKGLLLPYFTLSLYSPQRWDCQAINYLLYYMDVENHSIYHA